MESAFSMSWKEFSNAEIKKFVHNIEQIEECPQSAREFLLESLELMAEWSVEGKTTSFDMEEDAIHSVWQRRRHLHTSRRTAAKFRRYALRNKAWARRQIERYP